MTSVATRESACGTVDSLATLSCRVRRDEGLIERLGPIASSINRASTGLPNADVLHASALLGLVSGDTTGNTIERSISLLEMATRLEPSASGFSDLAAARLVYGAMRGGPKAIVEALDAAGRAAELAPTAPAALYNRALALDLLGLDDQATIAWTAFQRIDSTSAYAIEARRRIETIAALAVPVPPSSEASAEELGIFARKEPAAAQSLAWDVLFGEWGKAVLADDTTTSQMRFRQVESIARELRAEKRDASVSSGLESILRARTSVVATRMLANGHATFATSQTRARANAYPLADKGFLSILASPPPSPALVARARFAHANALIYLGRPDSAAEETRRFVAHFDQTGSLSLLGRANWNIGILQLRLFQMDEGIQNVERARSLFDAAGDVESVAATYGVVGESMFQSGDIEGGYREAMRSAAMLRGRPASLWRHNTLFALSRAAARDGLQHAARAFDDEDAASSRRGNRVVSVVEAALARARSAWLHEQGVVAARATEMALAVLPRVLDNATRTQLEREVDLTVATGLTQSAPDSAIRLLNKVIAFYTPLRYPGKLIPAHVARAAARLALGKNEAAEHDLSIAARRYDKARADLGRAAQRHAITTQARMVYDSIIMLQLRLGRPNLALAALERSRIDFGQVPGIDVRGAARAQSSIAIDYALIGDQLLTWAVAGRDTTFSRERVDRAALATRIERVRGALELGTPEETIRPDLSALYAILLRPIEARFSVERINFVTDGELSDVPFAALWNERTREYVAQRHVTALAPTLSAATAAERNDRPSSAVEVIANPQLDPARYAALGALPGADEEARATASLYAGAHLIAGADADSASVSAAMMRAAVLHFAGHAQLDDAQPWRSALALNPNGLTATAIASMDLHRLRLVVLSACETMRASDRRAGGFAGLTDAFLAAGAQGVVGSLWRVDDATTRRLMLQFHTAYRSSGNAARALRDAQLALRKQGDRSPAAWGAFRYVGR